MNSYRTLVTLVMSKVRKTVSMHQKVHIEVAKMLSNKETEMLETPKASQTTA